MRRPTGRGRRHEDAAVTRRTSRRVRTYRRGRPSPSMCSKAATALPFNDRRGYLPGLKRARTPPTAESTKHMADRHVPHLANDLGAEKIFVGVKELQCMGARRPFDHPHVFLDMGQDGQV